MATIGREFAREPLDRGNVIQYPSQSPVGGAIAEVGSAVSGLGERWQKQQEELNTFKLHQGELMFEAQLDDKLNSNTEAIGTTTPDGFESPADATGFHDNFVGHEFDPNTGNVAKPGTFDEIAQGARESLPEGVRGKFDQLLPLYRTRFSDKAARVEHEARNRYFDVELDKGVADLTGKVAQVDPNNTKAFEAFRQQGEDLINATGLPDADQRFGNTVVKGKAARIQEWRETASTAMALKWKEMDPAGLQAALGQALGVTAAGKESIGSTLEGALSGRESSGSAGIVNPLGYAGLFQFGAPRLASLGIYSPGQGEDLKGWSKSGKDAAGKWSGTFNVPGHPEVKTLTDFLASPDAQRSAFQAHDAAMDKEIDERGLDNYIGDTVGGIKITRDGIKAMIHLGGPGGARRALRGESVTDANGTEVLSYAKLGLPGAVPGGVDVDPRLQDLSLDGKWKLYNAAKSDARASDTQYVNSVEDYTASLRAGNAPTGQFSPEELTTRLGPEKGAVAAKGIADAAAYGHDATMLETASPAEVATILTQREQTLTSPTDFRQKAEDVRGLQKVIDDRETKIKADPSGYVMQAFPEVAAAWESVPPAGGPEYANALRLTQQAQAHLGVPPESMALLPTDRAKQIVTSFKNVDQSQDQRIGSVASVLFATPERPQRLALFQQLVKEGLPETTEGAFEALARGDEGASRRLLQASLVDPAKIIGKLSSTPDAIKTQIQTDIFGEGEIGDVAYGLSFGDVSNFERASRDSELMLKSVQMRLAEGQTLEAAVEGTKKDLFGDRQVLDASNAKLILDKGVDQANVTDGLEVVAPRFRKALEDTAASVDTKGLDTATGQAAIVSAATQNAIDRVMEGGVFRNVGDGVGLFDTYTGQFVAGADGKPLTVPVEEIIRQGKAKPVPSVPLGRQLLQPVGTPSPYMMSTPQ